MTDSEHATDSLPQTDTPDLRDRIALVIQRVSREGSGAESTADAVLAVIDQERRERCRDKDCARILPHGRISAHMWKHAAEAPFDHVGFAWKCFSCGLRKGHRIHRPRSDG